MQATFTLGRYDLSCRFWFVVTMFLTVHSGCGDNVKTATRDIIVRESTRKDRPLAYVGQILLADATRENGLVIVPLKYLGGEWDQNSMNVAIDVRSTVKGREVDMTVITALADGKSSTEAGHRLVLPGDSRGEFTVYYRDPDGTRHNIGELKIP